MTAGGAVVAVTGATGFIGQHLVDRLTSQGARVRILTRDVGRATARFPTSEVYEGDLAASIAIPRAFLASADTLFHCAGDLRDTANMVPLHVEGTARLLAAASGRVGRWVQLSSVGAYGRVGPGRVDESTAIAPAGTYEITKARADELVNRAVARGEIDAAILRPSIVFGDDMPNRSLAQWIRAIDQGRFVYLGPRGAVCNYVHVESVVDAMLLAMPKGTGACATYVVSEAMNLEDFVGVLCKHLDRRPPAIRLPIALARTVARVGTSLSPRFPLSRARVDALTGRTTYAADRIRTELGWVPSVPLAAGLARYAEHWKATERR